MPVKKKIWFIINPISGNNKKRDSQKIIDSKIDKDLFEVEYKLTKYGKHATEIAKEAVEKQIEYVIAVGGDGTVNEVSKALIGTKTVFGIVPSGSGNGLGRFLKIPLNPVKAIELINKHSLFKMDAIEINDELFVNMAGVGFDAHISHLFATYGKRGFKSYIKLILKEFLSYQPDTYKIKFNDEVHDFKAFVISFANSSQFGNNAHIAPLAEINDGLIDICVLKKFPAWKGLFISILLYTKGLTKSRYYKIYKTPDLEIINDKKLQAHIDGDPITFNSNVKLKILRESLTVVVP